MEPTKRSTRFTIPRRYYEHIEDYDVEGLSEAAWRPAERRVDFDPAQCALILLDVWSMNALGQERYDQVTRDYIKPVLEACREAGILVVHAPAPDVADKYPAHRFRPSRPDEWLFSHPEFASDWPTPEMRTKTGPYEKYSLSMTPGIKMKPEVEKYQHFFIHPAVAPKGDDMVVGDRKELHLLMEDRRVFHLFYTGFATNGCMLERDYGVKWTGVYLGYDVTLLRDCTRATEMAHTLATMEQTRTSIENLEFWISTTTSHSFLEGLREANLIRLGPIHL